ncbi:galactose-1-phosphate uridylyltransferase [Herbidospora daliensis]|uniref:galactose-1-phosphate uridylyltransferase n=1 Tax=Herbidospora daliensis TaxID=295585 RepID=UPI000782EDCC|nr:galactose-1-phosphate uridylyltransferase [Herbidospora daliensis]
MNRHTTRLADGRELIYFDLHERDHSAKDLRDLPPRPAPSELRHDPVLDEWVAVAGHRQTRTHLPPPEECPLCPGRPWSEIPSAYDVAVFENRFPSFSGPIGRCEVVCFTDDHDASFSGLSDERAALVMDAWVDRTRELSRLDGVEQVFCFENRGAEIGITLPHPHGQIYAYPYVTPRTQRMLTVARPGSLAAVVAEERAGERVVAANDHWTAFVPRAARYPFEVHLYPHRQAPDLPSLTPEERAAFGPLYTGVLRALDGLFGVRMPYVAAWHQAPVRWGREVAYVHMELFSIRRAPEKLKYLAGSESGMGAFVNDVRPEEAASMLRAASGKVGRQITD